MKTLVAQARQAIMAGSEARHGPLRPLLLAMTFVTGLVDAFSYLALGHVFVANMTGNVLFLGFALAGAAGFSIAASLIALLSFCLGAVVGGRVASRFPRHRGRLFNAAVSVQSVLVAVAVLLAALHANPAHAGLRYPLIVVLGIAMGNQAAVARRLALPDLTTVVLTSTITGAVADGALAGGSRAEAGRRAAPVAAMLLGGLVGAALVINVRDVYPLAIALIVLMSLVIATRPLRASNLPWVRTETPTA